MLEYWIEAIESGLEDCGAEGKLTDDEIKALAEFIMVCRENESLYTGSECIPNPLIADIEELKRRHAAEIEEREREIRTYKHSVAVRHRIDDADVFIEDDTVMYNSR